MTASEQHDVPNTHGTNAPPGDGWVFEASAEGGALPTRLMQGVKIGCIGGAA